jgi:hypothetical protein
MMRAGAVPRPTSRQLRACGLAALAEAGIVYLPAHTIMSQAGNLGVSVNALALPFAIAFVGGALLVCLLRDRANVPTAAGIGAVLIALYLGRGDLNREVFAVAVMLLVAIRVVTLGLRDWREPILASIGWGAAVLAVEVVVSTGPQEDWKPLLIAFVPVFFLASLGSRATIVWTTDLAGALSEGARAGWVRRALLLIGALAGAMVAAAALGVRGGALDRLGSLIQPVANAIAFVLAFVLAQLARPIFWLVDRLNVDPKAVQSFFDRLQERTVEIRHSPQAGGPSLFQRILGLVAFAAIVWLLVAVIRRLRASGEADGAERAQLGTVTSVPIPVPEAGTTRPAHRRHEPPADLVRRWYADTLALLRRKDVDKEPALTPAEFVPQVAAAFPDCATSFEALTRAYEDVRYGHREIAGAEMGRLESQHREVVRVVGAAPDPEVVAPPPGG